MPEVSPNSFLREIGQEHRFEQPLHSKRTPNTALTLYRGKSKYGGMEVSDAKRLRAPEEENRQLKQLVADLSLDKGALTTVVRKNGWSL